MSKHLSEFLAAEFQVTVRTVHPDTGGEFLLFQSVLRPKSS
jgi:hypothetical protein